MILNTLKIGYRNLLRNKGYSLINILGLSIGMCTTILLLMWVDHNMSYDTFHTNKDNLYQVVDWQYFDNQEHGWPNLPGRLIDLLKEKTPEIKYATNYNDWGDNTFIEINGKPNYEKVHHADPDFFKMFSFDLLKGNNQIVFKDPYSMVITQRIAKKYFGNEDPMGKIVKLNNKYDIRITGVLENIPSNSEFKFDIIMPFEFKNKHETNWKDWKNHTYYGFVQLAENAHIDDVNKKLSSFFINHVDENSKERISLFPLTRTHLYTLENKEKNIKEVRLFLIIALIILLIACFNFMNLSTAKAAQRAKEIGIKKTMGSSRPQLIRQFLFESIMVSFIALNFAIILVRLFIPEFNNILQEKLHFEYSNWKFLLGSIAVAITTGLLAGTYPAFFLTNYNPVVVLKGVLKSGKRGQLFRRILVIFQFSLSIILLISTFIIALQNNYIKEIPTGIDKSNVIYIQLNGKNQFHPQNIKEELTRDPGVEEVTFCSHLPINIQNTTDGYEWNHDESTKQTLIHWLSTDYDFTNVFKNHMTEGRFFSQDHFEADKKTVVINETLARMISQGSVLDKTITNNFTQRRIIGVIKDFNFRELHHEIGPLMIFPYSSKQYMTIRINPNHKSSALKHIKTVYEKYNSGHPPEINFAEDYYNSLYKNENNTLTILKYFAILAIIISCLGLFGLATFMAEERTKEIGIRKVMGASVKKLVVMSTAQFVYWVLLANILAWPIAWYFMYEWLNNFAFHIDMPWWVFVTVAALVIVISIVTVGYQSWRSATQDPVKSLKTE